MKTPSISLLVGQATSARLMAALTAYAFVCSAPSPALAGSIERTSGPTAGGYFSGVKGLHAEATDRVNGDNSGPAIVLQPTSRTRFAGQPVTFTIAATDTAPLTYQWLFNGDLILGATHVMLGLDRPQLADAGHYAVTVSNAGGQVLSAEATLTVLPTPAGPGSVDPTFDPTAGGELLAGWFSSVQGVGRDGIARLNPDGTLDPDFAPTLQGGNPGIVIWHAAVQLDGKILISGAFDQVNGVTRRRLARLQADGSLDLSFDASAALAGEYVGIGRVYLLSGGRLLIKDDFEHWNQHLLRLLADGTLDNSFSVSASGYSLYGVAVQSDSKIVMSASWPSDHSVSRLNADGSRDATFSLAILGTGDAHQIEVQADGKVLLAGPFSTVNGMPRRGFARLNRDGSLDTAFDPASALTNAHLESFAVLPNDRILLVAKDNFQADAFTCFVQLNADARVESSFSTDLAGPGNQISAIFPLPDRKTLVGGTFVTINGIPCRGLARLEADGTLDPNYVSALPTDGQFGLCAVQPDGRALVTGWAGNPDISYGAFIGRLNPDGTLDTGFGGGLIAVEWVNAMAVQPDGKILIGGSFTEVQGVARRYVARLHSDGSLDPSFTPPPLSVGDDHYIQTLGVQSDGSILVGGEIGNGVIRLHPDGSLDQDFWRRVSVGGTVFDLIVQPDDRILLNTGCTVDGTNWPGPARLNADGSLDRSFRASVGPAWRMALAPDGKVLVTQDNCALRLNPDGSLDPAFQLHIGPSHWAGMITTVAVQSDGEVLLGGNFKSVNDIPRHGIVRLKGGGLSPNLTSPLASQTHCAGQSASFTVTATGTPPLNYQWLFDGSLMSGATNATLVISDLKMVHAGRYAVVVSNVAGSVTSPDVTLAVLPAPTGPGSTDITFSTANAQPHRLLARFNPDGSLDTGFNANCSGPPWASITALALQADGKILIGGRFTGVNGVAITNLARLNEDGVLDETFNPGYTWGGDFEWVFCLALQPDDNILVAGTFRAPHRGVVRLHADGSLDTGFSPWTDAYEAQIECLAMQADGRIILGGWFLGWPASVVRLQTDGSRGTGSLDCLVRLEVSGVRDSGFVTILEAGNGEVRAVAVQPDGKTVISGLFDAVNSQPCRNMARLNRDGTVDAAFRPDSGSLFYGNALAVQADGQLVVGGNFNTVNGLPATDVVRLNGSVPASCFSASGLTHDGQFQTTLAGVPGSRYEIQTSTDLTAWTPLTILTNTGPQTRFEDTTSGGAPRRFYRAKQIP